jgi:regulator of nucleoside diphosphate kinase
MAIAQPNARKPRITIGREEHARLTRIADGLADANPDVSDVLMSELERARVVADDKVPADVVRIGSSVTYVTETGESRDVHLVYPAEADISAGKVSILTPIGTALLGLSPEQTIDWQARDGRVHRLTVKSVRPPELVGAAETR